MNFKNYCRRGGGVQFSYDYFRILGGYSFHTSHFSEHPRPPPGRNKGSVPKARLIQVRTSSQTKGLERGWKRRATLGRDAENRFFPSPHTSYRREACVRLLGHDLPIQRTCNSTIWNRQECTNYNGHIQRRKTTCKHASFVAMHGCHVLSVLRQRGGNNSEATTWKRQLGSDNSEETTRKVTTWKTVIKG